MYLRGVQADGSWHVIAGDGNKARWRFRNGGEPRNLTDITVASQARRRDIDTEVALTATIVMVDPVQGLVDISWDGDDVRTMLGAASSWVGVYDIQLIETGETSGESVHRGRLHAYMDVTR